MRNFKRTEIDKTQEEMNKRKETKKYLEVKITLQGAQGRRDRKDDEGH